jgi:Na+-translocating ferredoxin:NAD+ oxidoreductase RnfG subunit
VVAKQVARDGFSGEIKLCLNLNEVGNILGLEISTITKLYENIFI